MVASDLRPVAREVDALPINIDFGETPDEVTVFLSPLDRWLLACSCPPCTTAYSTVLPFLITENIAEAELLIGGNRPIPDL